MKAEGTVGAPTCLYCFVAIGPTEKQMMFRGNGMLSLEVFVRLKNFFI
jgi:hypothetical protein